MKRSALLALLGGLVASLCCTCPLLLLLLGLGTGAIFLFQRFHWAFFSAGLLLVFLGAFFGRGSSMCTGCGGGNGEERSPGAGEEGSSRARFVTLPLMVKGSLLLLAFGLSYFGLTRGAVPYFSTVLVKGGEGKPALSSSRLAELSIGKMTCSGCAYQVQGILSGMPGVVSTHVSFKEKKGKICYNPDLTTPKRIVERVRRNGFLATVTDDRACEGASGKAGGG